MFLFTRKFKIPLKPDRLFCFRLHRSLSSCCCLLCVWCWTSLEPSCPVRTPSWSTLWRTVSWWERHRTSPDTHVWNHVLLEREKVELFGWNSKLETAKPVSVNHYYFYHPLKANLSQKNQFTEHQCLPGDSFINTMPLSRISIKLAWQPATEAQGTTWSAGTRFYSRRYSRSIRVKIKINT